jgi:glyoxylase-like metal-dependent hydrolase (beta-lactamase superfamily II)
MFDVPYHFAACARRGRRSAFMDVDGFPPEVAGGWREAIVRDFHYTGRADAAAFAGGDVFHLGDTSVQVIHLPGHTRGHCGFLVEPAGVLYVADIDLTSFGPYYGDHWSDLEDFERSIAAVREIDACWYVTSHHKGVIEGRDEFVRMLDAFAAVIGTREAKLLEFLAEPRTLDDIAAHRFVYRPGADVVWADQVERTSMGMHLRRLARTGVVLESEPGRWRVAA